MFDRGYTTLSMGRGLALARHWLNFVHTTQKDLAMSHSLWLVISKLLQNSKDPYILGPEDFGKYQKPSIIFKISPNECSIPPLSTLGAAMKSPRTVGFASV